MLKFTSSSSFIAMKHMFAISFSFSSSEYSSSLSLQMAIIAFFFIFLASLFYGFLHLKHNKSLFSFHLCLSHLDEDSFIKESLLEVNFLLLNFSPLMNLLNFLMMRVKSSSSSLSFSFSTSYSSLVVTLRAMVFFFFCLPLLVASLPK